MSVCAHEYVFIYALVYTCKDLGKRQIERAFIYKPCSACCGSKLQNVSPASENVLLSLPWKPPSFAKNFTAVVEFRGVSCHSGA